MFHVLVFATLLATPGEIPDDVQKFLHNNDIELDDACHALKRFTLMPSSTIPLCKTSERYGIVRVLPKEGSSGCKTHYTLFEERSEHWVCQCNEGSAHSEMIVVERHDKDEMNNLRFPCQKRCYPSLLKHLIGRKSKRLFISYKEVRPESAHKVHDALITACAERPR